MELFNQWAVLNGANFDLLDLSSPAEALGNRLVLSKDSRTIAEDFTLAFVPANLMISRSRIYELGLSNQIGFKPLRHCLLNIARNPDCEMFLDFSQDDQTMITERITIMIFLWWQKYCQDSIANTEAAFWQSYINILPESFNTPIFLNDEKSLTLLKATHLYSQSNAKLEKLTTEFTLLKTHLQELSGDNAVELDRWLWADAVFWSRILSFQSASDYNDLELPYADDLHLVPLIDFCNHTTDEPSARWHLTPSGMEIRSTSLTASLSPGSELFFSYGRKSNVELMFIHGFCVVDNPDESIMFPAPIVELKEENNGLAKKLEIIVEYKRMLMLSFGVKPVVEVFKNLEPEIPGPFGSFINLDSYIVLLISVLGEDDKFILTEREIDGEETLFWEWNGEVISDPLALLKVAKSEDEDLRLTKAIGTVLLDEVRKRLEDLYVEIGDGVDESLALKYLMILQDSQETLLKAIEETIAVTLSK
ncbi:hypothetical protein HK098_003743 [Nowakowskiella sp. JEL0407]|nr:hypothetical protein HK098_003743 [Nowakowskiella sp. JEL0407]